MIKYAVKRCNSFGFATTVDKAKELLYNPDDIVLIDDENPIPDISTYTDQSPKFIVVLGKEETAEREILETDESDIEYLQSLEEEKPEEIQTCIALYKNHKYLDDNTLTIEFCKFLVEIYPNLRDSEFKHVILKILYEQRIHNADELNETYPLHYVKEEITIVSNTKPFSDIKIAVDKTESGSSSRVFHGKDYLQRQLGGDSTQLEAFSKGIFTVIHGKKSAGLAYENRLMNHDVLDLLARNGVMHIPKDMANCSFEKLMNVFKQCKSFDVVFVHPSLLSKSIVVETPSEPVLPEYTLQQGEIIAIAFRYICVHFFGYKGVYDESLKEYDYLF